MCGFCLTILEHTNLGKRNIVCYNFLLKWKKKIHLVSSSLISERYGCRGIKDSVNQLQKC